MITVINSKKIFQADPDTGENIGVHIYELVGASTDITGSKEGFLEWIKQNDIPANMPGAFGNGSTFYAIDTKKKFIFFNGQFYELPTQGGGESDPVDTVYDMVVKITIDETFEETGSLVANYTYDEIRDAIRSGKNVCGVLNMEGTAFVFSNVAWLEKTENEYYIRFSYMAAGISNGTDPTINDITCWMHSDSSIPYAEFEMNTIELATAGGGGGSDTVVVTFSDDGEGGIVCDKTCSEILNNITQANPITGYYLNSTIGTVYIFDVVSASEYGVQFESCSSFRDSIHVVSHEVVSLFLSADNLVDQDYMYYSDMEIVGYEVEMDPDGTLFADNEFDDYFIAQQYLYYEDRVYRYSHYDSDSDAHVFTRTDIEQDALKAKYLYWYGYDDGHLEYKEDRYSLSPIPPN